MKIVAVVAVLVLTSLAVPTKANAQDHAPTSDQCRADMRFWNVQIEEYERSEGARLQSGTPNDTAISRLTLGQINMRVKEMLACAIVDRWNSSGYIETESRLQLAYMGRVLRYVERHSLVHEMLQEDEEGLR